MRRHRVTLKGRIAHCDYGSRLCAYADRIRFRTDRNRPGVTDIDIVSAVVAQIPARKKAESGILVALGAAQSVSPKRGIEVHANALIQTDVPDCCIHFSTCKTFERRGTNGDISGANCVTQKRLRTNRRAAAGCVAKERLKTGGGAAATGCVAIECTLSGGRVLEAGCIAKEYTLTGGRVLATGCVAIECTLSDGHVTRAAYIAIERRVTDRRIAVADRFAKQRVNPDGCIDAARCVAVECPITVGCVVAAGGVAVEWAKTDGRVAVAVIARKRPPTTRRVEVAGSVEVHGLISKRCVVSAGCKAKQGLCALSRIPAGIAAIRWRDNCLRCLRKRKTCECEQRERCVNNMRYCFHLFIFLS